MDHIGSIDLAWAKGYNGTKAQYINRDVICFKCGNNVKFIGDDGHESVFPSPGDGVGALTVHSINHIFAFADQSVEPTIYVFSFPAFRQVAELKDGAALEYVSMTFSTSVYLATITGVPDHQLILWDYMAGTKLCSTSVSFLPPTCLTFNPANWRQLCLSTEKELGVWTVEQSNDLFVIHKTEEMKLGLPAVEGELVDDDRGLNTRASTRMSRMTLELPKSSIAGVKGEEAEEFEEYQDKYKRAVPLSHTWSPTGDILVGCAGGQLLKVDGESFKVYLLFSPSSYMADAFSPRDGKNDEESASQQDFNLILGEGSVNCIALHKTGLFVAGDDGILRHLELIGDKVKVKQAYSIDAPISSMSFNAPHQKLVLGSYRGSMHMFEPENPNSLRTLMEIHYGAFVGVEPLCPGTEHCVSVRADGEVQVWHLDTAKLLLSMPIGILAVSMASSPMAHFVAVGTASGHVYFISLVNFEKPKIIYRRKLYTGSVKLLKFTTNGRFLLTGADDGHVFVLDGRPSTNFEPLGHVDVPGEVEAVSTFFEDKINKCVVTFNSEKNVKIGASKFVHFELPEDLATDVATKHESLAANFKDEIIKRKQFNLVVACHGACLCRNNELYMQAHHNKEIQKVIIPNEAPMSDISRDSYLTPAEEYPGHQLPGVHLATSVHDLWLVTGGRDGIITVRDKETASEVQSLNVHDYRQGGINALCYSADCAYVMSSGYDGILSCFKWTYLSTGTSQCKGAIEAAQVLHMAMLKSQQQEDEYMSKLDDWRPSSSASRPASGIEKAEKERLEKEEEIDRCIEQDIIYHTPTPTASADATWLETKELEALKEEDKQYADLKSALRMEIRDMRHKLQDMMKTNEAVPDIEKLLRHEFDLDVEEQKRLQGEGESEVQRIREEKEFDNLAKMYLADLIRRECWDNMVVKGRGIQAFEGGLEVHNYPMQERHREELDELEAVQAQRRVEIAELGARREYAEITQKPSTLAFIDALRGADEEHFEGEEEEVDDKEKPSTTGSLGAEYGGGSDLFYSQFELHTREQKQAQIVLLKDAIYRIRQTFNKQFDKVYQRKQQEISSILEKNKRIKKILEDLDLPLDIYEPKMGIIEKPELLLTVADDEVKVEKFLTPEARRKQEEQKRIEEERRAKERGDNWRDRGLDEMMGGVLEIKKEDELKKDIPQPAFMAKAETEWSEDEKKIAADYERRVQELQEEREKYRKQLEMELKKLNTQIQESTTSFDENLQQIFNKKIKTEMVIYQEELKILRLKYSLLLEEELNNREDELHDNLQHKQQLKHLSTQSLNESRKHVDAFRDQYDILLAEDKLMDKSFKKEFHDVPALMVDQLYKLFRRRPKGQKARGADTPVFDPSSGNPFSERPSTARQNEAQKTMLETAMQELDRESNAPEGCDHHVWDRMCQYRATKLHSEQLVKQKALILADMTAFQQKRQEEDESLKNDIEDIVAALNKLKEDRMRFTCNLDVQLLLKQGQVEVDVGPFINNYTDSILIHRNVVEDLNGRIRQLGESKIASMMESKDFRKSIVQLEWEHKKMTMEMEDLQNKMRDIQNLKVTREIQGFLYEDDHDSKKAQEIATLEQTLMVLKEHHEKKVNDKKKVMRDIKRVIKEKAEENAQLTHDLEDLNVSVNERRLIHEVNADKRSDAGREKRYKEIVQRRKLVELAKAQAQEVAVLRAEVERLRMRTFPALVQVEH